MIVCFAVWRVYMQAARFFYDLLSPHVSESQAILSADRCDGRPTLD